MTCGRVTSQVVDCGQRDALFSRAEAVSADTGSLDALFNNAGVGYGARFADSSEANFEWLIDINFWGWYTPPEPSPLSIRPSGGTSSIYPLFSEWWHPNTKRL